MASVNSAILKLIHCKASLFNDGCGMAAELVAHMLMNPVCSSNPGEPDVIFYFTLVVGIQI
jgi:hypothetical protein